jgi:hypothetical protein
MAEIGAKNLVREANEHALGLLLSAEPVWIGVRSAREVIEPMDDHTVLHAGPPIDWERMAGIQKQGIVSGLIFEGLADSKSGALKLLEDRKVTFGAASDYGVIGAGVGIVTPSMKLIVCEDSNTGLRGYSPIWEGSTGLVAWGILNDKTKKNLELIINRIGPALDTVLRASSGVRIRNIITQGLEMGDEVHTREVAVGLILTQKLIPHILQSSMPRELEILCCETVIKTERWFHSIGMASAMAVIKSIEAISHCSLISRMAGNGVDFGIKISGLGERWFSSPAPMIQGKYLSRDWGPDDAIPWLGESCVTENVGLGGFAAAASPSVFLAREKTFQDAITQTARMRHICIGENHNYPIPNLNSQGPPIGIDIMKIADSRILPDLHGGIISREGGQIGFGSAQVPFECVEKALVAFQEKYELE